MGFVLPVFGVLSRSGEIGFRYTHLKLLDCVVSPASFLTGGVFECEKVKTSMARRLPVENLLPHKWGQLSTTFSNALKQPTAELLVAVNHNSYGQWRQRR